MLPIMELSGRLASFPIAELLHWAHNDRRTGSLVLRSAAREKRIYFCQGEIVTCLTDEPSEFYGQFLLLNGYLDQDTLYRCVSLCRRSCATSKKGGKRLGAVLLEEGLLDLADVQRTLRFHIEDVICDVFLWDHGVFFFRAEQPPREELLAEPIATLGLALEGSRWVDEVGRVREVLVDDNVVLGRTAKVPEGDFTPRQRRLVGEVDGRRRVGALYGGVHGSFYRFLVAAFELHAMGLVEVVHHGQRLHSWRLDAGLDDLLLEQATREQATARRRLAHLGGLERFVPIWVREPQPEEWERIPEPVQAFYRQFDGSHRLTEILSGDEEAWSRELELLMLQIGKEAVALLPAPLAALRAEAERSGEPERRRFWDEILA